MKILNTLKNLAQTIWAKEPLVVTSAVVSAVIAIASLDHIVLKPSDVAAAVVPILTALLGRTQVSPKAK